MYFLSVTSLNSSLIRSVGSRGRRHRRTDGVGSYLDLMEIKDLVFKIFTVI